MMVSEIYYVRRSVSYSMSSGGNIRNSYKLDILGHCPRETLPFMRTTCIHSLLNPHPGVGYNAIREVN